MSVDKAIKQLDLIVRLKREHDKYNWKTYFKDLREILEAMKEPSDIE